MSSCISARMAIIAIVAAATVGPAMAQTGAGTGAGQLYAFHSGKMGACPALDWHITVEPNKDLMGFVTWDNMAKMAKLQGALSSDGSFSMNAHMMGSKKMVKVTGSAAGDYINAKISGTGTACDNQNIAIPRVVGGTGGGG